MWFDAIVEEYDSIFRISVWEVDQVLKNTLKNTKNLNSLESKRSRRSRCSKSGAIHFVKN